MLVARHWLYHLCGYDETCLLLLLLSYPRLQTASVGGNSLDRWPHAWLDVFVPTCRWLHGLLPAEGVLTGLPRRKERAK